jgi:hypothetical protein
MDDSPGLQPWVGGVKESIFNPTYAGCYSERAHSYDSDGSLTNTHSRGRRRVRERCASRVAPEVVLIAGATLPVNTRLGRHFQGESIWPDPGLKPWAVVYNRCAVTDSHRCEAPTNLTRVETFGGAAWPDRSLCRAAAMDDSPGLQPWVGGIKLGALKVAPEVVVSAGCSSPVNTLLGRRFRGDSIRGATQG